MSAAKHLPVDKEVIRDLEATFIPSMREMLDRVSALESLTLLLQQQIDELRQSQ